MTIRHRHIETGPRRYRWQVFRAETCERDDWTLDGSNWTFMAAFPTEREAQAYGRGFFNAAQQITGEASPTMVKR